MGPAGYLSAEVDNDICLECAIHFWRAFKWNAAQNTRAMVLAFLAQYPTTSESIKTSQLACSLVGLLEPAKEGKPS